MTTPRSIRRRRSALDQIEVLIGLLAAAWVCAILVIMFLHHGALWRDEIVTLWMAQRGSIGELWSWLDKDSFPLAWYGVLRMWIAAGLGGSDQGLRLLGLLIGLILVGSMFWMSRTWSRRWPLFMLAIFALNPVMFRFCTSIRAYGLGMITLFLMVGSLWLYFDRPTPRRLAAAAFFSFLAVHSLYYNAVVLAAVGVTGIAIFLAARQFRQVLWLALVCGACAASILPYVLGPMTKAKEWKSAFELNFDLKSLLGRCQWSLDFAANGIAIAVAMLAAMVCAGCAAGYFRWHSPRRRRRALFIFLSMIVLVVLYFGFLRLLNYATQPWYYAALLAFAAFAIDRGADLLIRRKKMLRIARVVAVVLLVGWTAYGDYRNACTPTSHMDILAAQLEKDVSRNDFVIVMPWHLGTPFDRYYHGAAAWSTYPPLSDVSITRADLVIASFQNIDHAHAVIRKAEQTLAAGHSVWVLGALEFPPPGMSPVDLSPFGPDQSLAVTSKIWIANLVYRILQQSSAIERVDPWVGKDMSWPMVYELSPVTRFRGTARAPAPR